MDTEPQTIKKEKKNPKRKKEVTNPEAVFGQAHIHNSELPKHPVAMKRTGM